MKLIAAFISLCLFAGCAALGQVTAPATDPDRSSGAAAAESAQPASASPIRPAAVVPPTHKFLDVKNSLALAAFGAGLAGDSYSTQAGLAYPQLRELNPVARPFVSSRAGLIAYSGGGFALFGGGMYLAHRTGHHKVERIAPWVAAGWEGVLAGWNMHQITVLKSGR